ncbi:trans-sialidase, putative [Trypanosoma cruzi marinkellei]|uniref:Trans-sialidase, putative n=1 Tax=Trypanosoma cruzi marinkellei TaxID=85056 RepID=K2M6X7_TRYCR|nr:trans-sialidase, putative [Trypanosoma cruzi marinkellei]
MGVNVTMNEGTNTVLVGLSYNNNEKKWQLLCGDENNKVLSSPLEPDTTDHVVILLRNGNQTSAYVDGQRVGNGQCELENADLKEISHFYIGGDGGSTGSRGVVPVTVTNVLLYNRPLSDTEIGVLNAKKVPISMPEGRNKLAGDTPFPAVSGLDAQGAVSQPTSGRTERMEQEPLKGGDVAQTVATGSGDTKQGSGSPQTTEVSVNSGGYGETAGEKDAQGERIRPQDREINATALRSNLGNFFQGNNTDASTVCGSGVLPSLLLLLLGLWRLAAL